MKKFLILLSSLIISTNLIAAGGDGGGGSGGNGDTKEALYDDAVKLVKRAGKLEKKRRPKELKNFILKHLKN